MAVCMCVVCMCVLCVLCGISVCVRVCMCMCVLCVYMPSCMCEQSHSHSQWYFQPRQCYQRIVSNESLPSIPVHSHEPLV